MPRNRVLYQKTSNHANVVLDPINPRFVARGPRASQPCAISKDVESS